ncbi:hypothetical protein GOODEAATRI_019157 [Goodea atripinnis]|uniref:Uncharacterized protein n=1 Tax=Goodea atripinnis TaxID=208336 RepID=A0ABV0MTC4_9TELE
MLQSCGNSACFHYSLEESSLFCLVAQQLMYSSVPFDSMFGAGSQSFQTVALHPRLRPHSCSTSFANSVGVLSTKPVITCLKTFLISYSLIFWFTGVILLAVGVWGKVSLEAYFTLISEKGTNAPYVLIGTGAIIVIFGLFGCFATCRGSPWMLKLVSEDVGGHIPFSHLYSGVTVVPLCFPVCHVSDSGLPG